MRLALAALATASMTVALAVAGAGPALAGGSGGGGGAPVGPIGSPGSPGGSGNGQTGSGSYSNGTYTSTVAENVSVSSTDGGAATGFNDVTWTPPECWLQPDFLQPQTYTAGDPSGGPSDAASYWFWFGDKYPGFAQGISQIQLGNGENGTEAVLQEFNQEQHRKRPAGWTGPNPITASDVWWVPNWLNSAAGWACANNLVATDNLSDGFLGMYPPAKPGVGGPGGQITSKQLSGLARAALRLPHVTVVTSPPVTSAVVNVPLDVSIEGLAGNTTKNSTATLNLDGQAYLSATVTATLSSVQVQVNGTTAYTTTGFGDPGQTCAANGDTATSACTVTFEAPTTNSNPYSITVTENWTVSWTTSAGDGGTFAPAQVQGTSNPVTVKEIQSTS